MTPPSSCHLLANSDDVVVATGRSLEKVGRPWRHHVTAVLAPWGFPQWPSERRCRPEVEVTG